MWRKKMKLNLQTMLYFNLLHLAEFEQCDTFRDLYIEILRKLEREIEVIEKE